MYLLLLGACAPRYGVGEMDRPPKPMEEILGGADAVDFAVGPHWEIQTVWVQDTVLYRGVASSGGRIYESIDVLAKNVETGDAGQVRPDVAIDAAGHVAVLFAVAGQPWLLTEDGSWTGGPIDPAARGALVALTFRGATPVAVWLDNRGGVTTVYAGTEIYAGGDDGVCMCCRPAVIDRPGGPVIAFRDADGARRDVRMIRHAGTWSDLGDATTGRWSPGGCPADGPVLSEVALYVSDGRDGARRIYRVADGEEVLPVLDANAQALQPRVTPDDAFRAWVEETAAGSTLVVNDGSGPKAIGTSTGRMELGDPTRVGGEVWLPWRGEVGMNVARVAVP